MKTDTIYGIVASAFSPEAIGRIYDIKRRDRSKACIVLIPDIESLQDFGVDVEAYMNYLNTYWPGPVSIIVPVIESERERLHYIHRGTRSIAFRLPDDAAIRELLRETGPLVAPSANPEGHSPAMNIEQARAYFDDQIDYYEDAGQCEQTQPSKLIHIDSDGNVKVLR